MEPQINTDQDKSKQQRTPLETADFVLGGSIIVVEFPGDLAVKFLI
jgi:hypothetical protein